jgi:hypothetical protein
MDQHILSTKDYVFQLATWANENDVKHFKVKQLPDELKNMKWLMRASYRNYIKRVNTDPCSNVATWKISTRFTRR